MAFLRKRAGVYSLTFWWKGKSHIKSLGTDNEAEAEQIKKDAEDQLDRIRKGKSALASKLLADGHSILDVLFGAPEIGHLLARPVDDNPLTLSQLRDAFIDHLRTTDRTPGHLEGTRIHLDHFIRVLGDERVMRLTDNDMARFKQKRENENAIRKKQVKDGAAEADAKPAKRGKKGAVVKRRVSHGTIRSDFKSLKSAVNWAMTRKPPLLTSCSFTIPSLGSATLKPFLPTEEISRLLARTPKAEQADLVTRWVLDLDEINELVRKTAEKMPEMLLPIQLVCSTGMRRIQLVRLKPTDYVKGTLTITSKKGARERGLSEVQLTVELKDSVAKALDRHIKKLPRGCSILFPIFDDMNYSGINARWKGNGKRTLEQRRCDRADRLFEKLERGTDFQRLDGYHALRHSFISILVSQGKTWDQIAAFVGHLDPKTTHRYIHFMPKDKRTTVESIPFEF